MFLMGLSFTLVNYFAAKSLHGVSYSFLTPA